MYSRSAEFYDAIYSFKDYEKEAAKLHRIIQRYKRSSGNDLLDAACGTGSHIAYLRNYYSVEGLDINQRMLRLARKKHPSIVFHQGDMVTFKLKKQFDVITCLFSAIGHLKTKRRLDLAIRNMAEHLKPGGLLVIEPWLTPQRWHPRSVHANFVDKPDLKIARMNVSKTRGRLSVMDMHHLVGTPSRVQHFVEKLVLRLYTSEEYVGAFSRAKLETTYDPEGLIGRGLYIGTSQTT